MRVQWLIITGSGFDLLALLLQSQSIITAHNQWLHYQCLIFCCDWHGSDLRFCHLRITKDEWRMKTEDSLTTEPSWTQLTSRRTEYGSPYPAVRVLVCFIRCHGNLCLASRWLALDLFVAAGTCVTEPWPSMVIFVTISCKHCCEFETSLTLNLGRRKKFRECFVLFSGMNCRHIDVK
jgi:hypothetical protein